MSLSRIFSWNLFWVLALWGTVFLSASPGYGQWRCLRRGGGGSEDGTGTTVTDTGFDTAASSPTSLAPNMLGDTPGAGSIMSFVGGFGGVPLTGGHAVGRFKVSENTSPVAQDRVFLNYNHLHNAYILGNPETDVNVDRFTLGIEKSFQDGLSSIELRIPFASTVRSDLDIATLADSTGTEFGDIALNFKRVLVQRRCAALSAGLGLTLPTGSDSTMTTPGGDVLAVENSSIHLDPYLGLILTPTDRLFTQLFLQFDIDTGSNEVLANGAPAGSVADQSLLCFDWSIGYWIYQTGCCGNCGMAGIAPMFELHYTTTISDTDSVAVPFGGTLENRFGDTTYFNMTAGVVCATTSGWRLRVAAVAPLLDRRDRRFDTEFLVQANRRF